MPALNAPAQQRHFEALYAADDDPWQVATSWYEQRKRALLLACLHKPRYRCVFEPGCGNGEMSAALAARCDELLAVDGAASAVAVARQRLHGLAGCTVAQASLPDDWPRHASFDLIVISELAYYFDAAALTRLAQDAAASLADDGMLVLCHWLHDFDDRITPTGTVHDIFGSQSALLPLLRHQDSDFLLQAWRARGQP